MYRIALLAGFLASLACFAVPAVAAPRGEHPPAGPAYYDAGQPLPYYRQNIIKHPRIIVPRPDIPPWGISEIVERPYPWPRRWGLSWW